MSAWTKSIFFVSSPPLHGGETLPKDALDGESVTWLCWGEMSLSRSEFLGILHKDAQQPQHPIQTECPIQISPEQMVMSCHGFIREVEVQKGAGYTMIHQLPSSLQTFRKFISDLEQAEMLHLEQLNIPKTRNWWALLVATHHLFTCFQTDDNACKDWIKLFNNTKDKNGVQ